MTNEALSWLVLHWGEWMSRVFRFLSWCVGPNSEQKLRFVLGEG